MVLIQTYKYLYDLYHLVPIVHEVYKATYNWPPLCRNHLQPILNDRCMKIGYTVMHGILMDFDGFWFLGIWISEKPNYIYIYIHYIHCNWPRNPTVRIHHDSSTLASVLDEKWTLASWDFSTKPGISWDILGSESGAVPIWIHDNPCILRNPIMIWPIGSMVLLYMVTWIPSI